MNRRHAQNPVDILLVEDCPTQVRHVRDALQLGKFKNRLHTVGDGTEAMSYLRREAPYQEAPVPSLVLLDLGLQQNGGVNMLAEMKATADLRHIPVVVLTSMELEHELPNRLSSAADDRIFKPFDLPKFINAVQSIKSFSLMLVQSPQQGT